MLTCSHAHAFWITYSNHLSIFSFCSFNISHFQETQTGFNLAEPESMLIFDGLETVYPRCLSSFFYTSFDVGETFFSLVPWWAKYKWHIRRRLLKMICCRFTSFLLWRWDRGSECHLKGLNTNPCIISQFKEPDFQEVRVKRRVAYESSRLRLECLLIPVASGQVCGI